MITRAKTFFKAILKLLSMIFILTVGKLSIGQVIITNDLDSSTPNGNRHQGFIRMMVADNGLKPFCDDGFTMVNAHVACTSKGYAGALALAEGTIFGNYNITRHTIGIKGLLCTGSELSLSECPPDPVYTHPIGRCFRVAGLVCSSKQANFTIIKDYFLIL